MPRPQLAKIYLEYIALYTHSAISNYELAARLNAHFNSAQVDAIGQPPPAETTVRRYRKRLRKPIENAKVAAERQVAHDELDTPWRLQTDDPDGIPPHVCSWIIDNILPNDFIMRDRALLYPKFTDPLDAVTRRTAKWISALFGLLKGENPLLVWSIAWMYSGHELARLTGRMKAGRFDTRAFDYHVSCRPWKSSRNYRRYAKAVEDGQTTDINETMFGVLHRLQILNLNELSPEQGMSKEEKQIPETPSHEEQGKLLVDHVQDYWINPDEQSQQDYEGEGDGKQTQD